MAFAKEAVAPFLRGSQPSLRRSAQEAVDEFWQQYGGDTKTYTDWLRARNHFRSQIGNIPVVIRGGGRAAMWTAEKILKDIPNAHVVMYDDADVLGGNARRAISPLIPSHAAAKTGSLRDAMKLLMHPRLDVLSNTTLSNEAFERFVRTHTLPVAIDAPGAVPKRGSYPYGKRVWDIMDLVENINKPFDEDGHFRRVNVPVSRSPEGRRLPNVSVIGGNTGRDAQIAFALVHTAQDIADTYKVPIEDVNHAKILEDGIVQTRKALGLAPLDDLYIYWKPIGEMANVKKLFKQTGKLQRGDPELSAILTQGILGPDGWQEKEGGIFLGETELAALEDDGSKVRTQLRHTRLGSTQNVDSSLALISTGFQAGTPFRVQTESGVVGTDVGMKVEGSGDLPATMVSVKASTPDVIQQLTAIGNTYPEAGYRAWVSDVKEQQKKAGMVGADGIHVDPISYTITHGPKNMTERVFIGFVEADQPVPVRTLVDA